MRQILLAVNTERNESLHCQAAAAVQKKKKNFSRVSLLLLQKIGKTNKVHYNVIQKKSSLVTNNVAKAWHFDTKRELQLLKNIHYSTTMQIIITCRHTHIVFCCIKIMKIVNKNVSYMTLSYFHIIEILSTHKSWLARRCSNCRLWCNFGKKSAW